MIEIESKSTGSANLMEDAKMEFEFVRSDPTKEFRSGRLDEIIAKALRRIYRGAMEKAAVSATPIRRDGDVPISRNG